MISTTTTTIIIFFVIVLFLITYSSSSEDDVQCLLNFQSSVSDPESRLSWNFANISVGSVCSFTGVTCRKSDQNSVSSLSLPYFGLSGLEQQHLNAFSSSEWLPAPISSVLSSLSLCSNITALDLSSNSFSGSIPSSLCTWLPNLVTLNLSSNFLTGTIPANLSNCAYLTNLDISHNNLSGEIPSELSMFDAPSFDNNPFLCGYPISPHCSFTKSVHIALAFLGFGFSGFIFSVSISYVVWSFCFATGTTDTRKREQVQQTSPLNNGPILVRMVKNPTEMLSLPDLMTATRDFHPDNIVVVGNSNTGTSYEGVLPDGSSLIVKLLSECRLSGRQFRTEMSWIRQIRHPNLVPLLGFCTSMEDKYIMYKTMFNGALSSLLQCTDEILDWERRLRIGAGVAQGLAWLHHRFQVPLLHRNLCSSAVLLDEYYEPSIADFGLVGLFRPSVVDDGVDIHPSSFAAHLPTTKDDVYDFGVILLELATGRCALDVNSNSNDLVRFVHELSIRGQISYAMDRSLKGKGNDDEIVMFLKIACKCVDDLPNERPSMVEVCRSLKRIGSGHEISESWDEESMLSYCNESMEVEELVIKLAYCIYTGTDPFR